MRAEELLKHRRAGILLHITSLPGPYDVGDMGPEAYRFADFLNTARQKYWQILPLNPVNAMYGYSPYSSISAFAGNTMLISPELLQSQGFLSPQYSIHKHKNKKYVNFQRAEFFKDLLIRDSYNEYKNNPLPNIKEEFEQFCHNERSWLDDYALFKTIKKIFEGRSWISWPVKYRDREAEAIQQITDQHPGSVELEKYAQFLFFKQWLQLKDYCNKMGIAIFGDISLYINYDSSDVWSHSHLFQINENKEMTAVSGVPPDYFNNKGQIWNLPLYNWDSMRYDDFRWWKDRIRKNLNLFDMVRMDHFRGFSAYFSIPAHSEDATGGVWHQGPAFDFFESVKREFPDMPFIAEDLGDIDAAVYALRDRYNLPGMSVLQFAFGDRKELSVHSPHNHIRNSVVYTGTHDNPTAIEWFRNNLSKHEKNYLSIYAGKRLTSKSVGKALIIMCYQSVANTVIIPLQDLLKLGKNARMNTPSVADGNWEWRLRKKQINGKYAEDLSRLCEVYER